MTDTFSWVQEVRKYIVLAIVVAILFGLTYAGVRYFRGREDKLKNELARKDISLSDRDRIISEKNGELTERQKKIIEQENKIRELLLDNAKGRINYVCKNGKITKEGNRYVCSLADGSTTPVEPPISTSSLFKEYCADCGKNNLVPQAITETNYLISYTDICSCDKDGKGCKGRVEVKPGKMLVDVIQDEPGTIWKHDVGVGYEVINNGFTLAYSPINYKGGLIGVNMVTDFKTSQNSGVGLFIGYKPEIDVGKESVLKFNFIAGGGALSHFDDLGKIGPQAFVGAIIMERDKRR